MKKSVLYGVNAFCRLCGAAVPRVSDGSLEPHTCAPIAAGIADSTITCGPAASERCAAFAVQAPPPAPATAVEIDLSQDDSLERAKRFFFDWPKGARVTTDHEIIYVCEDVDGILPAGSLGTIVRRAMVGLYVVRWDAMPGHELATSADCLFAALPAGEVHS